MAKVRFDIKQHVTDTIIAQIEAGTPPWRKPWTGEVAGACFPLRHTGEKYQGVNVLMLWATAMMRDYKSARWMTFRQARDLGGCVRKGAKSAKSVYYGTYEREVDGETETLRVAKWFNVFNADQIDGLPEDYYILLDPPRDLGTEADPAFDAFFAAIGAAIITGKEPKAYYDPARDHIHMPPIATFYDAAGYYGTLSHEIGHYVLADHRIGTQKKCASRTEYSTGELEAEIFSAFLAVHLGFEPHFDQTAVYIESWLQILRDDRTAIFKAAAQAQKAFDYVLSKQAQPETSEAA